MATRNITDCDVRLQSAWANAVAEWNNKDGLKPSLSCCYRSPEEQDELYKKVPAITHARSFQSPHNFTPSQAFDFFFQKDGKAVWTGDCYKEFIALILKEDSTLVSGASFKGLVDTDHFETPDWRIKFKDKIPK